MHRRSLPIAGAILALALALPLAALIVRSSPAEAQLARLGWVVDTPNADTQVPATTHTWTVSAHGHYQVTVGAEGEVYWCRAATCTSGGQMLPPGDHINLDAGSETSWTFRANGSTPVCVTPLLGGPR